MLPRFVFAAALCVGGLSWAAASNADEKPLWEAGLGVGALVFPDYRGSDETQIYPVPVPYFVYRGDFLKADRDGVRGLLFNRDDVELSFSVDATIPVSSEHNAARRGMPDLRPTLEVGPSLDVHLWRCGECDIKLDLIAPLRVPITVERSPHSIGWTFSPRLNLDIENVAGHSGWNFGAGMGVSFAAEEFHDYFYTVASQFATPERPAYQARKGYSGAHVLVSLSKRFPKYWVGAYMRYDALGGAVFEDSPLVRQTSYLAGGLGIAWMIGASKRMVEADE